MRASLRLVIALGLCSVASAEVVHAADSLRCGSKLVATGDSTYDVRVRCGEPAFATRRVEYRTAAGWGPGASLSRTVEVVIEEWTYDFGPQRFVQHLLFEQGRLILVTAGHRGQKKPE